MLEKEYAIEKDSWQEDLTMGVSWDFQDGGLVGGHCKSQGFCGRGPM